MMTSKTKIKFTLVELLIVIAIIAILMTMLLPALRKAKSQAYKALCTGNLRQLFVAYSNYAVDYDDCIPFSHSEGSLGSFGEIPYAPLFQYNYIPGKEDKTSYSKPVWRSDLLLCPSAISNRPIWGGGIQETAISKNGVTGIININSEALARLAVTDVGNDGKTRAAVSHYGVNSGSWNYGWDGPFSRWRDDRWRTTHKFSWVKYPSECWLIGDGYDSGLTNACFRHNKFAGVAHVDGHIGHFKIIDLKAKNHLGKLYINDNRLRMMKWNSDPGL